MGVHSDSRTGSRTADSQRRDSPSAGPRPSTADRWVDELVPEEVDWRDLVCRYPVTAISLAALGGFLVGWSQGSRIVAQVSDVASSRVSATVDRYFDSAYRRGGPR